MTLDDCGQSSWWAAPGNQGPCGWAIRIERIRRHRTVPSSVVAGGDSAVASWAGGLTGPGVLGSILGGRGQSCSPPRSLALSTRSAGAAMRADAAVASRMLEVAGAECLRLRSPLRFALSMVATVSASCDPRNMVRIGGGESGVKRCGA